MKAAKERVATSGSSDHERPSRVERRSSHESRGARRSDVNMGVAFIIPEGAHGGARLTETQQYTLTDTLVSPDILYRTHESVRIIGLPLLSPAAPHGLRRRILCARSLSLTTPLSPRRLWRIVSSCIQFLYCTLEYIAHGLFTIHREVLTPPSPSC